METGNLVSFEQWACLCRLDPISGQPLARRAPGSVLYFQPLSICSFLNLGSFRLPVAAGQSVLMLLHRAAPRSPSSFPSDPPRGRCGCGPCKGSRSLALKTAVEFGNTFVEEDIKRWYTQLAFHKSCWGSFIGPPPTTSGARVCSAASALAGPVIVGLFCFIQSS